MVMKIEKVMWILIWRNFQEMLIVHCESDLATAAEALDSQNRDLASTPPTSSTFGARPNLDLGIVLCTKRLGYMTPGTLCMR